MVYVFKKLNLSEVITNIGKSMFLEKPAVLTLKEGGMLLKVQKETRAKVMVAPFSEGVKSIKLVYKKSKQEEFDEYSCNWLSSR